jgi:hypothetical protein
MPLIQTRLLLGAGQSSRHRSRAISNPIGIVMGVKYATFTNGITRTIWLLTQGCAAFPVKCEMACAQGLFLAAGAKGTSLYTARELADELLNSA